MSYPASSRSDEAFADYLAYEEFTHYSDPEIAYYGGDTHIAELGNSLDALARLSEPVSQPLVLF